MLRLGGDGVERVRPEHDGEPVQDGVLDRHRDGRAREQVEEGAGIRAVAEGDERRAAIPDDRETARRRADSGSRGEDVARRARGGGGVGGHAEAAVVESDQHLPSGARGWGGR